MKKRKMEGRDGTRNLEAEEIDIEITERGEVDW